jgi:hypothetical protein
VNSLIDLTLAPAAAPRRSFQPQGSGKGKGWRTLALGISLAVHAAIYLSVDFGDAAGGRLNDGAAPHEVITVAFISPNALGDSMREKEVAPASRRGSVELVPPAAAMQNGSAALLPLPLPPRPHYFPASQLTLKPVVLQDIPANLTVDVPNAPAQAAVLRLLINELGEIDKVIVDESSVPERAAQAITEAFRSIRFRPGERDGAPVKSQLKIQIMLESMIEAPR